MFAHFFEGAIAFGEIWMQLVAVRSVQQKATKIIGIYLKTHFNTKQSAHVDNYYQSSHEDNYYQSSHVDNYYQSTYVDI